MTIDPTWTVWCDIGDPGDGRCHHWCQATGMSKRDAWHNARAYGWRRINGAIVCPGCQSGGSAAADGPA